MANGSTALNRETVIKIRHMIIAIISISVLIAPFMYYIYVKSYGLISACIDDSCRSELSYRELASYGWLGLISLSATSGCLGIIVSFFLRQTKDDPVISTHTAPGTGGLSPNSRVVITIGIQELLLLCFLGSVFGFVMFALFVGGFVQGSLFPNIMRNGVSWLQLNTRISDWAKLFVWCFLAGFSERLVPNFLDNLVRKAIVRE